MSERTTGYTGGSANESERTTSKEERFKKRTDPENKGCEKEMKKNKNIAQMSAFS